MNHSVFYLSVLCLQYFIKKIFNTIKIEKFIGKNSFNLWCIKMQALLNEHGPWAPLSNQSSKIDKSMLELYEEKTHSLILLSFSDEVLYDVSKELSVVELWLKLEKFLMTKSI